jgi:hypothetical protein
MDAVARAAFIATILRILILSIGLTYGFFSSKAVKKKNYSKKTIIVSFLLCFVVLFLI